MGLFSAGRGPRSFDYEPRFYDPDEDEGRELKRRMQSRRSVQKRRNPLSLLIFLGLLVLTIMIYYSL